MASFGKLTDSKAVVNLHSGAVTIYVEGKDDVDFLEKMFPGAKADIRFEEVGGCAGMRARVAKERQNNKNVIGLLDRDALKRESRWTELFDTDNDNFAISTRLDGIYVLTRWEIENYLLDLTAVYRVFVNWKSNVFPSEDALLDVMIETALGELHVTAGWCTAHEHGIPEASGPSACVDVKALEGKVREWIVSKMPEAKAKYDQHLAKVRAFDPGAIAAKRERLTALLRMVDGKRFLHRLRTNWLGIKGDLDPAGQLADNVGQIQPRGDDLFLIVDSLRQSA